MKSQVRNVFSNAMLIVSVYLPLHAFSQEERALTRQGNKDFNKGNFTDAEANYKKALDKKNNFPEAIFNLGDAIYKQGKRNEEAAVQFDLAAKTFTDNKQKAKALHNLGNALLSSDKYEESVSAYKQALKLNPNDQDTKYNLAYAQAKLKQQQQQNKDNKNDKNKDQEQKKPDSPDKKDKKDDNKGENKGDNKDKQGQQPQPKLSKEAAEKLLQALQNEEQKTQEKMNKKQARPVEVKIEKDW